MMRTGVHVFSALLCGMAALALAFAANGLLVRATQGLWTLEEGAPWAAIYAVFVLPAVFSFTAGLLRPEDGVLMSIVSPFAVAIVDVLTCLIIGLFLTGEILECTLGIIFIVELLGGPVGIVIEIIFG